MDWRGKKFWFSSYFVVGAAVVALLIAGAAPALADFARKLAADFFYPYLAIQSATASEVAEKSLLLEDKSTLAHEIERLRSEVAAFSLAAVEGEALAAENAHLRRLLLLEPRRKFHQVAASVILLDPAHWRERFTIDRGSRDGVMEGCAVVAMREVNGLTMPVVVGIVASVSGHTAEVSTLYDPFLRLPVYLEHSQAVGFLNGANRYSVLAAPLARIDYLPLEGGYRIGDRCLTTGFNPRVPEGLLLGELAGMDAVDPSFSGELYRNGFLRPTIAGPDSLRFVCVLTPAEVAE